MLFTKLFPFTIYTIFSCLSYEILLVFPLPSRSHAILGEGFVRHLLGAGHEVTYITSVKINTPHPRLTQIDISSNYDAEPLETVLKIDNLLNAGYRFKNSYQRLYTWDSIAYNNIMHPTVQGLIQNTSEHFDVVIAEWLFSDLYSGLSTIFNCPLIWLSSLESHSSAFEIIDEVLNTAYNPSHDSDLVPPFSFWDRVTELWTVIELNYQKWWLRSTEERRFIKAFAASLKKSGRLPSYDEVRYNASLMFGNSNVASGSSIRLPQNYIPIGGYHIKEGVNELPQHIKEILDNATNGLIYFSLGSMIKSNSLPNDIKRGLFDTFRKLNQTIIWKFEEEVPDLPQNVHIMSWAPQVDILAHPNCKLFITHGGLLSIIEAIHFRVPIIGIPLFADQNVNVNRAVKRGFGKRLNLNNDIVTHIEAVIKEVLYNDSFYKKIEEYSFIYHDRVTPPGKLLTHWVSHVVRTKGAPHLRSPALMVPWYQKLYVDLAVLIIVLLYIVWKISFQAFNKIVLLIHKLRIKQKSL